MKNADLPAMPQTEKSISQIKASIDFPSFNPPPDFRFSGLTKREYFAAKVFASMTNLTNDPLFIKAAESVDNNIAKAIAETAVSYADVLLMELEK